MASQPDIVMLRILWCLRDMQDDGDTYQVIGERMGYAPKSARKSAHQFLKTKDPHISMLRKFANAAGLELDELVDDVRWRGIDPILLDQRKVLSP